MPLFYQEQFTFQHGLLTLLLHSARSLAALKLEPRLQLRLSLLLARPHALLFPHLLLQEGFPLLDALLLVGELLEGPRPLLLTLSLRSLHLDRQLADRFGGVLQASLQLAQLDLVLMSFVAVNLSHVAELTEVLGDLSELILYVLN